MEPKPLKETIEASCNALREQLSAVAEAAAKSASIRLNQISRCMRHAENLDQWLQAVMDGTIGFCARAALFAVEGNLLLCRATRGLDRIGEAVPMASAPALASAVESQDTVVAMCTAGEMSKTIALAFKRGEAGRAHLIPLSGRKRCLAVLYAEETTDLDALELLMAIAASAREHIQAATQATGAQLVEIKPASANTEVASAEQLRARRFAQARVAGIRLLLSDTVEAGRTQGNLYSQLRDQIDLAREFYRQEYGRSEFEDYLHFEIVRTLANDDANTLGSEYPGPIV